MKSPETLIVIRHGESKHNALKAKKEADPEYQKFMDAYKHRSKDPKKARELAEAMVEDGRFRIGEDDRKTKLTDEGQRQAEITGKKLSSLIKLPDVVFVSTFLRTHETLGHMAIGWPELGDVRVIEDERLREQEYGLSELYGADSKIFNIMHPDQEALSDIQGPYWYRFPQGENGPDLRERIRSMYRTIGHEFPGQTVLAVTHHLPVVAFRANLEHLSGDQFAELDENEKPVNCGVTIYERMPDNDELLRLSTYNQQLY